MKLQNIVCEKSEPGKASFTLSITILLVFYAALKDIVLYDGGQHYSVRKPGKYPRKTHDHEQAAAAQPT